jgi:hypothetical protein
MKEAGGSLFEPRQLNWVENVMDALLRCQISPGMFSGEVAVCGRTADGAEFSLFVPEEFVEFEAQGTTTEPVEGRVCVEVLAREGRLLLVRLPGQTFENGQTVTVRDSDVEFRRCHEIA